ncbi:MAG: hypothetical protein M5U26_20810 [Planctomycetota bacterium]|nr:hypothetical protein [Planctomycetota bacterium]
MGGTQLLALTANGDLELLRNLDLHGSLGDSGDGLVTFTSGIDLGANDLTTTGTINAGSINVSGGFNVSGISSATNATVTIDNDGNGSNTFQVIGNTAGPTPVLLASLDESSVLALGPTTAATPTLTTAGINDLTLMGNGSGIVIVNDALSVTGGVDLNGTPLLVGATLNPALFPANLALLDAVQTFTRTQTIQGAADTSSLVVRQSGAAATADIFRVTNSTDTGSFLLVNVAGRVQVPAAPVLANDVVNKTYADTKASLAGDTFTGALVLNTGANPNLSLDEDGLFYNQAGAVTLTIDNASGAGTTNLALEGNLTGTDTNPFFVTGNSGLTLDTAGGTNVVVDVDGAGVMNVNRVLNATAGLNVTNAALTMGGQNITGVGGTLSSQNGTFTVTSTAGNGTINVSATGNGGVNVNATGGTVALNGTAATGGTIATNTTIDGAAGNSASSASATPSVINLSAVIITADTTVTNLTGGIAGQVVTIVAGAGTTSVQVADAGNFSLSAAFNGNADDTLTVVFNGAQWIEVARSAN